MLTNIYPQIHTILYMMRHANMLGVLIRTLLTVTMNSITCVALFGICHIFKSLVDKGTRVETLATRIKYSTVKRSTGSTTGCTITEKAPTRAFSWLKAPTSAFTFKTLLRHYAKR